MMYYSTLLVTLHYACGDCSSSESKAVVACGIIIMHDKRFLVFSSAIRPGNRHFLVKKEELLNFSCRIRDEMISSIASAASKARPPKELNSKERKGKESWRTMTQDDYQSSTTQLVHLVLVDLRLLFVSCSGMVKKSSLVLARKRLLGYLLTLNFSLFAITQKSWVRDRPLSCKCKEFPQRYSLNVYIMFT